MRLKKTESLSIKSFFRLVIELSTTVSFSLPNSLIRIVIHEQIALFTLSVNIHNLKAAKMNHHR